METLFITNTPALRALLDRRRLRWRGPSEALPAIAAVTAPTIVYVDPAGTGINLPALVRAAEKNRNAYIAVIDPKSKIKRVIDVVHQGAVDYLAAGDIPKELSPLRFKKAAAFVKKYRSVPAGPQRGPARSPTGIKCDYKPVLHGWSDVKAGREYTFSIMFIELDEREEMENRYGVKNLANALATFRAYVEKNALAFGGKIWLWSNFGGIILFPFNAQECNSVLCGFRMVMYKFLHDAEESHFPNFISFRIAIHLGNVVYQEARKGEVISDSLNTVFHLGQKFAQAGHFYVTEDIFAYSPEPLRPFFKESNSYENRTIYRMRAPVL